MQQEVHLCKNYNLTFHIMKFVNINWYQIVFQYDKKCNEKENYKKIYEQGEAAINIPNYA